MVVVGIEVVRTSERSSRSIHQVGVPQAQRWLRDFTATCCDGVPFQLRDVYLSETPDFTPLVRCRGQFEEEDAGDNPVLAIARFVRYMPSLKTFLSNRCPRLPQEVAQFNSEHRDRPLGSNPLDYFEHPVRDRATAIGPDFEGAGAQFQRDLQAIP